MKIVASGMSGLVGTPLAAGLTKKYELVRLVRRMPLEAARDGSRRVLWNPPYPGDWMKEIDGAYAVINLSGESIAGKRWSPKQKEELKKSRIQTTKALVEAISQAKNKPKVFLNASAIGFYGPRGPERLDENSQGGQGFLPDLCKEWEAEAFRAEKFGVRTVMLRTGIVLSKNGGALAKMLPPFQFYLGGPLGSGKQVLSWIHIQDEVEGILKVLEDPSLHGAVNLTAPHSVTMTEFSKTLGRVLQRPAAFPVPSFVLKILLGEMSELLLTGQSVYPQKLTAAGFKFRFQNLENALRELI